MNSKVSRRILVLGLALGSSFAFAHGDETHPPKARTFDASKVDVTDFGQEGNPDKVTRTIKVDMTDDMRFTPSKVSVKRGENIRFVVHNDGKILHEMVLGTSKALKEHAELMRKFPEMEHADANIAHVKPGSTGEIVWQFNKAGDFEFACLQPGHFEAGMVGKVNVK
ncbi:MAG: cupredoxin family protein [Caldimonas sp.]